MHYDSWNFISQFNSGIVICNLWLMWINLYKSRLPVQVFLSVMVFCHNVLLIADLYNDHMLCLIYHVINYTSYCLFILVQRIQGLCHFNGFSSPSDPGHWF